MSARRAWAQPCLPYPLGLPYPPRPCFFLCENLGEFTQSWLPPRAAVRMKDAGLGVPASAMGCPVPPRYQEAPLPQPSHTRHVPLPPCFVAEGVTPGWGWGPGYHSIRSAGLQRSGCPEAPSLLADWAGEPLAQTGFPLSNVPFGTESWLHEHAPYVQAPSKPHLVAGPAEYQGLGDTQRCPHAERAPWCFPSQRLLPHPDDT